MESISVKSEFECSYLSKTGKDYVYELNSHRYRVELNVVGPQRYSDFGYVLDFSTLKGYVDSILPDKSFLISDCDAFEQKFSRLSNIFQDFGVPVVILEPKSGMITAEYLIDHIVSNVQHILDMKEPGLFINKAILRENNQFAVEYHK